jgi:hypothetical protein
MNVGQTYVSKFFVEEIMNGVEIIDRLNEHYVRDAIQRTQVYHWIKEVKSGRKDPSNILLLRRAPNEGPDDCIEKALKEDPRLSRRKIAEASDNRSTTVRNDLTKYLGMKCYHMRCVPHTLTVAQKLKRKEMVGSMLRTLEGHAASNFHFL